MPPKRNITPVDYTEIHKPEKKIRRVKYSVARDDLHIPEKAEGLNAFTPFRVNSNDRTIFKVGESSGIIARLDGYHTQFPNYHYSAIMYDIKGISIPTARTRSAKIPEATKAQKKKMRQEIERFISDHIKKLKGKRLYSTARIRGADPENLERGGETEWFYTREHDLHSAWVEAAEKYNATYEIYLLKGKDENGKMIDVTNDKPKGKSTVVSMFVKL
jgi:hypothetical protein